MKKMIRSREDLQRIGSDLVEIAEKAGHSRYLFPYGLLGVKICLQMLSLRSIGLI